MGALFLRCNVYGNVYHTYLKNINILMKLNLNKNFIIKLDQIRNIDTNF